MKNLWKNGASAAAAAAIVAAAVASPASAITKEEHYPETPKLNPTLPIVNTTHGSDHIKANILNPHPVCNSGEDYRTVVYKVDDKFTGWHHLCHQPVQEHHPADPGAVQDADHLHQHQG